MTKIVVAEEFTAGDWRVNVQFGGLDAQGAELTGTSWEDVAAQVSATLTARAQPAQPQQPVDQPAPPPVQPPVDAGSSPWWRDDGSSDDQESDSELGDTPASNDPTVDAAPAPKAPGLQPGATSKPGPGNMPHTPAPPTTPVAKPPVTPATPVQPKETALEWIEEHLHIPGHPLPPKKS